MNFERKGTKNMTDNINMADVVAEVKNADEEKLKEVIEKWFESTHLQGLKTGAGAISAVVYGTIRKHLYKPDKQPSLRDYKRCVADITELVSKQLKTENEEPTEPQTENTQEEQT